MVGNKGKQDIQSDDILVTRALNGYIVKEFTHLDMGDEMKEELYVFGTLADLCQFLEEHWSSAYEQK